MITVGWYKKSHELFIHEAGFHEKATKNVITRGRSRKFRKGWLGHLPTCQLSTRYFFYFSEKSVKIIQNFKKKRGGRSPLGPPLNPPLITKNNQWLPVLHNMETKSHSNHLQYTELFITTAIFQGFFPQEHFNVLVQVIRHTFYFDCNHCYRLTSHRLLSLYRNEAFQLHANYTPVHAWRPVFSILKCNKECVTMVFLLCREDKDSKGNTSNVRLPPLKRIHKRDKRYEELKQAQKCAPQQRQVRLPKM